MSAARWQQIKAIIHSALELDSDAVPAYLDEACGSDADLRAEVESFIALQGEAKNFLEGKPAAEEPDPLIGRKLGDFIIAERLGAGGFGNIYRATQPALHRETVIKIINENSVDKERYKELFVREARLASQLEHPYTTSIYAFGVEADGLLWIAMEFVRGTPLNRLLKKQGPLPLEQFIPLITKICEVVQTAHESGIIHRDLKPANVMIISRAGKLLPKLLDFGIAKSFTATQQVIASDLAGPSENSLAGARRAAETVTVSLLAAGDERPSLSTTSWTVGVGGTPPYMAPEQWRVGSVVTTRADIYALGVLSYELLTGHRPFDGDIGTLFHLHSEGAIPPLGRSFPAEMDRVIAKAMAKRPEDRFNSAIEFATALRAAAGMLDDQLGLISFDDTLRENLLTRAPQPIAEAVANLATARNLYQAREQIVDVVRASVRYLGLLALCGRAKLGNDGKHDSEELVELLQNLRRDSLDEEQWLALARELCRPFARQRAAYPIPKLLSFFFEPHSEELSEQVCKLAPLLKLSQTRIAAGNNEQLRTLLNQMMVQVTTLLRALSFLCEYQLVVAHQDGAELWMGNHLRTRFSDWKGVLPSTREPLLVNNEGEILFSLRPFAVVARPTPGAREELFWLEGNDLHGAKLVALPSSFEYTDEEFWPWFEDLFEINAHSDTNNLLEQTPYLGLSAFEPKDAAIFFGREKEIEYFLNRLRIQPLLILAGPSGVGKSSFIQAGVVPSLKNCWAITVRPGATPLATLSTKLLKEQIICSDLRADLQADAAILGNRLQAAAVLANRTIILIVDQLEELFTLCPNQKERELYASSLAMAVGAVDAPVRVIFTLRDDFLSRARTLPILGEKLAQGLELLTTPSRDNLVRILVEPARRAGYQFEDERMAVEIAETLVDRPIALPLLAFFAAKLWELRDQQCRKIRRKTYEELGGVGGALAEHAERVFNQMLPLERKYTRAALRHLVTSEGTRAVLSRGELEQLLGKDSEAQTVLERLISARLLSAYENENGIENIEVVHETLLTAWPRLVKWRQEDGEGARLRDQLREAVRQWQERGRPKGLLWRDEALEELKLWQSRYGTNLTESERAFSQASFAEATRSQWRRRLIYSSILTVLIIALTVAFWINREIEEQLLESYLDQGRRELFNGRPRYAALYFNEVYKQKRDDPILRLLLGQAMRSVDVAEVASFGDPGGSITRADLSPDGRRVLIPGDNNSVSVWDVATSQRLFLLSGHTGAVTSGCFSPDGKLITTTAQDGTIRFWQAETGQLLSTINHAESADWIQFSSDSSRVVISNWQNARIFEVSSGNLLTTIVDSASFSGAAFSPDGRSIVTAGKRDRTAKVWDCESGKLILSMKGHTGTLFSVCYSPDGTRIATTSDDRTAKIWNASDGSLLFSLEGHKFTVTSVAFSPNGKLLATSSFDKTIKLWDTSNGRMLTSLELHVGYIWFVDFNSDGSRIFTASGDGTAKVWDVSKFRVMDEELIKYSSRSNTAEYSKDGRFILTSGAGNQITIFDAKSRKPLRTIKTAEANFLDTTARFSPDSSRIVTTNYYQVDTAKINNAGNNEGSTAKVWDVETGRLLLALTGHEADLRDATFSPDGARIVTASADMTAKVWDANTGKLQLTLAGHQKEVLSAEFSPDGRQIITASTDTTSKLWDATDGRLLRSLSPHSMTVIYATFSPDGRHIVTTSTDTTAKLLDAATGEQLFSLDGHVADVRRCIFSPDGRLIATASGDFTAKIWDGATGKMITSIEGHSNWVNSANFSLDNKGLITTSNDGTVRVWRFEEESRTPEELSKIIEQRVPFRFDQGQLIPTLRKPTTK